MIGQILDIRNYAFSIYSLPTFLIGIATTLMGGYVFIRIHTSKIGFRFFMFTSALTLWQISFGMSYCSTGTALSLWWSRLAVTGVVVIPVTNYSFVASIVQINDKNRWFLKAAYVISFILGFSTLFSNALVKGVSPFFWGYYPQFGVLGIVLLIFYVPMLIKIFGTLWTGYKDAITERTRKRMKGLLWGLFGGYCSS